MLYLIAFFASPLALLFAGKPVQAFLNAALYALAWIGLLLFVVPGMICWLLGVIHACMVISNAKADRRADRVVQAIREKQG